MRSEKPIEIEVKAVFTGRRSAEQAFIELIRRRTAEKSADKLELMPNQMYNGIVVLPAVREAPERGTCYE